MVPSILGGTGRRTTRYDRQIQRILAVLRERPMTLYQLAEVLFIGERSAGDYIRLLYKTKRVYISGWLPTEANKPSRIYAVGNLRDARYVTKRELGREDRIEVNKKRLLEMLALPQTVNELAERSEMSKSRARELVAMLKKEGRVYIKAWKLPKQKGSQAPIYAVGNSPDCARVRYTAQTKRRAAVKKRRTDSKAALSFMVSAVQAVPAPYAVELERR